MKYVDETRSLITGNPLEDLPCSKPHPEDPEKDCPASESLREDTPVGSNSASRETSKIRGAKSTHACHSPSGHVMYPRTKSTDSDPPTDEHLQTKGSASPFDIQPWRMSPPSNPLSPGNAGGGGSLQGTSAFPLKSRTEAVLFRHYIAKLAPCVGCRNSRHLRDILTRSSWTCVTQPVTLS